MKMKKLLKNAVVYAVAASMLVATPLTASAGLIDAYSISDGTDQIDDSGDPSHTGTVTSTDTNTSVLGEDGYDAKIVGIALDQTTVTTEVGEHPTLKASVIFDGRVIVKGEDGKEDRDITDDVVKQISNKITWKVTRLDEDGNQTTEPDKSGYVLNEILSITAHADDRSVVELNPRRGTKYGNVFVTASIGGDKEYEEYTYEDGESVKTDKILYKTSEVFEKSAEVSIKEYATSLKFKENIKSLIADDLYKNHTVDLSKYLDIESDTANDTITWTVVPGKKGSATITADGVVTFKQADDNLVVTAVSEKGEKASVTLEIADGQKAKKVIIEDEEGKDVSGKKKTVDMGGLEETTDFDVTARMVKPQKVEGAWEDDDDTTDVITWSSNKTGIVKVGKVSGTKNEDATLIPVAVGTATITAKASGGASAKLTVTVKATLNGLEITNTETSLYSGQTLQMTYERTPEQSKDAVKWSIAKVLKVGGDEDKPKDWIANPNATINAKGVLTIKPELNPNYLEVTVELSSKNKVATEEDEEGNPVPVPITDERSFTLEQSEIESITVKDGVTGGTVAKVDVVNNGKSVKKDAEAVDQKNTDIYVPKNRSFTAIVNADAPASSLTWSSNKAKVASVTVGDDGKAVITANSSGTATITVSGVYKNNKGKHAAIKATFKVNVKQPATSLTLNNTLVVKNVNKKAQAVTFKATQGPKGAKETVTWTATENGKSFTGITQKGKLTIPANTGVGTVYTVTVKTATGMSATATVKILEKTSAVEIHNKANGTSDDRFDDPTYKDNGDIKKHKWNNTTTKVGKDGSFKMYPEIKISDGNGGTKFVTPGTENAETITYSVNKKGIVNIASDGTVTGLKAGTVKITAKTPTGKKATLTVVVK